MNDPTPQPTEDVWRCEQCGEAADPVSAHWRWTGEIWEHHHGYPAGHIPARNFGPRIDADPPVVKALKAKLEALEGHAADLALALDGYQITCGEGHARPNYDCPGCGAGEAILTAYQSAFAGIEPKEGTK